MGNTRRGLLLLVVTLLILIQILAQVPRAMARGTRHKAQTIQAVPQTQAPQTQAPQTPTPQTKPTTPTTTKPKPDQDDDDDSADEDEEAEGKVPKIQQNPFKEPDIDKIITGKIDDELWATLKGGLPCLELSRSCIEQLQAKAIANSPLLKELDSRLSEATDKTDAAKKANKKSLRLEIFTPALQYLLNTAGTVDANGHKPGFFERLGGLFLGKIGIVNDLLAVLGIPLFNSFNGGSSDTVAKVIQVSDLQVRIAELQRARAELADKVKEKVTELLTAFDESRVEYQMSQVIIQRAVIKFNVTTIRFRKGELTTEEFFQKENELDKSKSEVYTKWAKLRRELLMIKLLVLAQKEDDG